MKNRRELSDNLPVVSKNILISSGKQVVNPANTGHDESLRHFQFIHMCTPFVPKRIEKKAE